MQTQLVLSNSKAYALAMWTRSIILDRIDTITRVSGSHFFIY